MKDVRLWPVEIFGPRLRIERPSAERDHLAPRVGDREHDPVAETVIGRAAIFGRDQETGLDQFTRLSPLGNQIVFQGRATGRRITNAKACALSLWQGAPIQIGPRLGADRAAQFGLIPSRRENQPIGQGLLLLLALNRLRVLRGQGHPCLSGQALDRLHEAQALRFLQEADQVAMFSARKTMVEALVIIDEKGRRFFLGEG